MSEQFDMGYIAYGLGLSPTASQFFAQMTEPEWIAWGPRYHALLDLIDGKSVPLPDITWWEQDFFDAMMAHRGMMERMIRAQKLQ